MMMTMLTVTMSAVMVVVTVMQLFLGGRGAQFPVPWYLVTVKGIYLQAVLRRQWSDHQGGQFLVP